MLARLQAEYESTLSTTYIPIFTDIDNLKGLGLATIAEDTVPYQFIDLIKKRVYRFKSRRELEEHIGRLTEADFKRYENQEAIKILANEKSVDFGLNYSNHDNIFRVEERKEAYDLGYRETIEGIKRTEFPNFKFAKAYKRGVKDAEEIKHSKLN